MKKIIYGILTAAMAALMLTGCGGKSAAGWWVRPEDYEAEGLSMIDCFYVDEDMETFTVYNAYGEAGDTMECSFEKGVLTMDLGFFEAELQCKGDKMLSAEDGELEYERVEEPAFQGGDLNFDGLWYLAGAENGGASYEITGKEFRKTTGEGDSAFVESEGTLKYNSVQQIVGSIQIPDVLTISTGENFAPSLIPSSYNDGILFEEDGFDCALYVHQDAMRPEMEKTYAFVQELMSGEADAPREEGGKSVLQLKPAYFTITNYVSDGGLGLNADGDPIVGQWYFAEPDSIVLQFDDGTEETVPLLYEEGMLRVETVQQDFAVQEGF